jgi:hypothetical protein
MEGIKSSICLSKQLQRVYIPIKGFLGPELAYTRWESNTIS